MARPEQVSPRQLVGTPWVLAHLLACTVSCAAWWVDARVTQAEAAGKVTAAPLSDQCGFCVATATRRVWTRQRQGALEIWQLRGGSTGGQPKRYASAPICLGILYCFWQVHVDMNDAIMYVEGMQRKSPS